jgi:peptidoglycan/xylan/chitin deacetylase (PgdA/CDA1 family)
MNFLQKTLIRTRAVDAIRASEPNVLTVLNYHRINDPFQPRFDTFRPNISCTPAGFAEQMNYVQKHYNVITVEHLVLWLRNDKAIPPHAAIITFDDGYFDNLTNAYPILKERNIPALIFLTTDYMDANIQFYWDYAAYCFYHTSKQSAYLPVFGTCAWSDQDTREALMMRWIEAVKQLEEDQKRQAVERLAKALDVSVIEGSFENLYLTWEQVRLLSQNGIEFGSHTRSHPILTRIPLEKAREELIVSKKRIEEEINKQVISFAYPNGQSHDFSPDVSSLVREAGMEVAFTLLPGPTRYSTIRKNPLAIRRIFLIYHDSLPRFVIKISGLARLFRR